MTSEKSQEPLSSAASKFFEFMSSFDDEYDSTTETDVPNRSQEEQLDLFIE